MPQEVSFPQEISKREELELRRESFSKIVKGSLFDISRLRYFIATEQPRGDTVRAVELNSANRARIIAGKRCRVILLLFDDMRNLGVEDDEKNLQQWKRLRFLAGKNP